MADQFVAHCLELLAPMGAVRAKRMFGGHGLYVDELFVALIAFDRLYLKVDDQTRASFDEAGCQPFTYLKPLSSPLRGELPPEGARGVLGRPGAASGNGKPVTMSYWTAPEDAMESPALMQPWARLAIAAALRAKAAKTPAAARKPRATPRRAAAR
jgi:DNA transformation protein and related proteins